MNYRHIDHLRSTNNNDMFALLRDQLQSIDVIDEKLKCWVLGDETAFDTLLTKHTLVNLYIRLNRIRAAAFSKSCTSGTLLTTPNRTHTLFH